MNELTLPESPGMSGDPLEFLASVSDCIEGFFYRRHNDSDYTMLRLTSGFERLLGLSSAEWVAQGRSFAGLIHPEDIDGVVRQVDQAIARRGRWKLRYRLRRARGDYLPVFETGAAARAATPGGAPMLLDGVILDAR